MGERIACFRLSGYDRGELVPCEHMGPTTACLRGPLDGRLYFLDSSVIEGCAMAVVYVPPLSDIEIGEAQIVEAVRRSRTVPT